MSLATMKIEPEFSALEREELAHLDYFARRIDGPSRSRVDLAGVLSDDR